MDFYKQFEELGRKRTVKEAQEVEKITRKEETRKYPHNSTSKKGTGEYFSSLNDKIILLKHMAENPTLPDQDREYITENLRFIDSYERKGLFLGAMNGMAVFFFPAIRRLPLYYRLPICSLFVYFWCNWGYNYGRDYVYVKTRNVIENWERDMGLRHFQTGN